MGHAGAPNRIGETADVPNWSTRKELAAFLGLSLRSIDRLRRNGLLKAFKFGRIIRFKAADVLEFLARRFTEGV